MKPNELYDLICSTSYIKSGQDVDWQIVEKEGNIYLLFQPSMTKQDWKVNFNFPIKPYKNQNSVLFVHRGFANAYKSCNDEIMNAFCKKVMDGHYSNVFIAGYSYGGAMAQLASEDFFFRTSRKAIVVTFGAPKIAGGIKTKRYLERCARSVKQYAHKSDIVPKVPPFYFTYGKLKVGKFKFTGLFHPEVYHCKYREEGLY